MQWERYDPDRLLAGRGTSYGMSLCNTLGGGDLPVSASRLWESCSKTKRSRRGSINRNNDELSQEYPDLNATGGACAENIQWRMSGKIEPGPKGKGDFWIVGYGLAWDGIHRAPAESEQDSEFELKGKLDAPT